MKTSKEITENFYQAMFNNQGWEDMMSDQITYLGPLASLVEGKESVVAITQQFLKNKYTGEVKDTISEGDNVCVRTHYQLGHPDVELIDIDACEIVKIKDGKILSMEAHFDSLKVSQFGEKMQKMQAQQ